MFCCQIYFMIREETKMQNSLKPLPKGLKYLKKFKMPTKGKETLMAKDFT